MAAMADSAPFRERGCARRGPDLAHEVFWRDLTELDVVGTQLVEVRDPASFLDPEHGQAYVLREEIKALRGELGMVHPDDHHVGWGVLRDLRESCGRLHAANDDHVGLGCHGSLEHVCDKLRKVGEHDPD